MSPASSRTTRDTACAAKNSGSICSACSKVPNHSSRRWNEVAAKLNIV
jgi:hypothetical protein